MGAGKFFAMGAAKGAVAGAPLVFRAVVWSWKALIAFGAWVVSTRWGRITGKAVLLLMLLDAAWGSDGVGFSVLGCPLAFVVMIAFGGVGRRRLRRLTSRIEDAVRSHVPGYYRGDDVRIRYEIPTMDDATAAAMCKRAVDKAARAARSARRLMTYEERKRFRRSGEGDRFGEEPSEAVGGGGA